MRCRQLNRILIVFISVFLLCCFTFITPADVLASDQCEHEFTVTVVRYATDDRDGLRRYVCDKCGYTYTEAIPATGHDWGGWQTEIKPTCGSEGRRIRTCKRCSRHEYEIIPATGDHSYTCKVTKKADCVHEGVKTYTCSVCGSKYTEAIPATGHDWGEWVTDIKATDKQEGHRYRVCRNDSSHVEEETIAVTYKNKSVQDKQDMKDGKGGSSFKPNRLNYILTSTAVAGSLLLAASLIPSLIVLIWYKRKKKEYLEQQRLEEE